MQNKYLLDTNVLIYYFNGLLSDDRIDTILSRSFQISIITKIEFLGWQKLHEDIHLQKKANDFLSHAHVFALTEEIAEKVIDLRRQVKIKTPDAIIGATALVHGLDIVTNNVGDFKALGMGIVSVNTTV